MSIGRNVLERSGMRGDKAAMTQGREIKNSTGDDENTPKVGRIKSRMANWEDR